MRQVVEQLGFEPVPDPAGTASRRFRRIPADRRTVHFLHIGKNAGTKVSEIIRTINAQTGQVRVIKHSHHVSLGDIPETDAYFFSIRNPIKRFFSGFYSRKRKGMPRFFADWSAHEERAFGAFAHANDLAEALFEDSEQGRLAVASVRSIAHLSANQVDWFTKNGFFLELRPPIWIIRQENFDQDLATFVARLNVDVDLGTDEEQSRAHGNDYSEVPELSDKAIANLQRWYSQDIAFYDHCAGWLDAQTAAENQTN